MYGIFLLTFDPKRRNNTKGFALAIEFPLEQIF